MYTYTYHPDVHYPYICTDVPAEESPDSYSLSPETSAGQYYVTATTTSPTHLWAQPSEWSSSEQVYDYHPQVHSYQSYPHPYYDVRNGNLSRHTQATGYPPAAYSESTVSGGASMPIASTASQSPGDASAYSHEEAEAEECPPRCDVFDDPLRRENYIEMERIGHGGKTMDRAHGSVGEGRVSFHERQQQQVYAAQPLVYVAEAPYSNQHVYGDAYGQSIYQERYHQPPSQPPRKAYPVHPQVCYEQEWAVAQASPSIQQQGLPMETLRAEHGFGQRQEERPTNPFPQTVMAPTLINPYFQIPGRMWPQRHPSPAPAAIPISSSSSLANAITPPVPMVKKTSPRPKSTTTSVPATTRRSLSPPVPPKPPTPVPIVPSQSHLAPPPVPFSAGSSSKDTASKAAPPQSPSIPPPRLPRNPRREQSSFRLFHPYPAHRHPSATSLTASSSHPATSSNGRDLCSATISRPITPVFGFFGSYTLALLDGSNTALLGPTCAPETSSSVMRLALTPALKKHYHQGGVGGAGEGLGCLAGLVGDRSVTVPPVVKRLRLACLFCRKRKIACGPGPGAGEEGSSSVSEGDMGAAASTDMSVNVSATAGGKASHHQNQEDDGPCNQCARRGLRCERPTKSRRALQKAKKST